ncbi:putative membrane protein [Bacteroides fragilis str. 3-F-2 |nr:putative membrane protein [Bacteroides fragilis str. 3-F-2 \
MSETLIYPGESDVILIRSIFVDYIVANLFITAPYGVVPTFL